MGTTLELHLDPQTKLATPVNGQVGLTNTFIAVPCYDTIAPEALEGLILATKGRWLIQPRKGSLLSLVFNQTFADALNTRNQEDWTHYAMHHADIQAPPLWVDTLIEEMRKNGADIIAAVVSIKDNRRLTTTGLHKDGQTRRLSMKEIHKLPPTFDARDAGAKDGEVLAINTGLWLCDFKRPWVNTFPGFTISDAIIKHGDGLYRAHAISEDWNFSVWAAKQGLRVMATSVVPVVHYGRQGYGNEPSDSGCETDPGDG